MARPATIPNYVRNAIKTLLDRQRDRGEKPEFVLLRDGRGEITTPGTSSTSVNAMRPAARSTVTS